MKEKSMSKKTSQFFMERNSSKSTQVGYNASIKHFEKCTGMNLDEMITIAKTERKLDWEDTHLRSWLIIFRNYLYNNFKESSAKVNLARIRTIFHHFRVPMDDLPYFSTKQTRKSEEIDYEDLPDREILKKCIEIKNPLLKALTLFISSAGTSRRDTSELRIKDYVKSVFEYTNTEDIYEAIRIMGESEVDIVPTFKLKRRKTGETYRTFASPEAVKAINIYLLSRKDELTLDSKLFNVNYRYINTLFKETNDTLNLGEVNDHGRFCPQMLRSYQATQLSEAGMNDSLIDLIQGRKPSSIARKSYIRVKRETLKEEYIRCLPFLVVEDIEKIRTELDVVKDENSVLKEENHKFKEVVDNIDEVIERKIREAIGGNDDKFEDLFS